MQQPPILLISLQNLKKNHSIILSISGITLIGVNVGSYLFSRSLTTPSITKAEAPKPLIFNSHPDIQEFFQYLKAEQIKELGEQKSSPLQDEILEHIAKGSWNELASLYTRTNNENLFFTTLDSAFFQGKNNNIDDLVMAYMVVLNSQNGTCRLIAYETAVNSDEWLLDQRVSNINDVPSNQLYFLEFNKKNMSQGQLYMISQFFSISKKRKPIGAFNHRKNNVNPLHTDRFLIASPSLARKDTHLKGTLKFIYKMPKPLTISKYLLKKENVFSLFHPKDTQEIFVHDVHPTGLISYVHDAHHASERSITNLFEKLDLLDLGKKIGEFLRNIPNYSKDSRGYDNFGAVYLTQSATEDDLARLYLEKIQQKINDAESIDIEAIPLIEQLDNIVSSINRGVNREKRFKLPSFHMLLQRFKELGFIVEEVSYKSCGFNFIDYKNSTDLTQTECKN